MTPIQLEGAVQYGKPVNWNDERDGVCATLPVVRGTRTLTSVWTLSDSERRAIARGQNISLSIVGFNQPPVLLKVVNIQGEMAPGFAPVDVVDPRAIGDVVESVMGAHPDKVAQARRNETLIPWFVGKTMNEMKRLGMAPVSALVILPVVRRRFALTAESAVA